MKKIKDIYTQIENTALQLSESILELNKNNVDSYELVKFVLSGIYTQGYRDCNIERESLKENPMPKSLFVKAFEDLK